MEHYKYTGSREDMLYLEEKLNEIEEGCYSLSSCSKDAHIIYIDDGSFSVLNDDEMNEIEEIVGNGLWFSILDIDTAIKMIIE